MSDKIVLGTFAAIEQPEKGHYDPNRGHVQTRTWRGPKETIIPLISTLQSTGCTFDYEGGPVWTVTATIGLPPETDPGDANSIVNTWELSANAVEKDVFEHPNVVSVLPDTDADIERMRKAIASDTAPSPAFTGNKLTIYNILKRGVKSTVINAPVMRHSQTVNNQYAIPSALANVGRIYSSALLGVPDTIANNLPSSGASSKPGRIFGWKKKYPQIQQSAFSKAQIVQEYEYGEWVTFLDGVLLTPT